MQDLAREHVGREQPLEEVVVATVALRRARPSTPVTVDASSTARTVFVGMPNQSVVAPCARSKSADDSGPSARMRSSTSRPRPGSRRADGSLGGSTSRGTTGTRSSARTRVPCSAPRRSGAARRAARTRRGRTRPRACRTRSCVRPATASGSNRAEPSGRPRAPRRVLPRANAQERARAARRENDVRPRHSPSPSGRYRVLCRPAFTASASLRRSAGCR